MRTFRALAVVLLLAVGITACGSDDGGSFASGSSSSSSSTASTSDKYEVDIKGFAFNPKELDVEAGEEVTVTNDDGTEHTFTLDDGSFDSGHIGAGKSITHAFDTAGSYSFHCEIHPSMKGTIKVS